MWDDIEFWWATLAEREEFQYVQPAYQKEFPNCQLADLYPEKRIRIEKLRDWCVAHNNLNVHRDLKMYSEALGQSRYLKGPVLLDLDNTEGDLLSACLCVSNTLVFLRNNCKVDLSRDSRVFFSGRKGFHIEIRPTSLDAELLEMNRRLRRPLLYDKLIDYLRTVFHSHRGTNELDRAGTILDKEHAYKRINGSINAWKSNGCVQLRKMILVTPEKIFSTTPDSLVAELVNESEERSRSVH